MSVDLHLLFFFVACLHLVYISHICITVILATFGTSKRSCTPSKIYNNNKKNNFFFFDDVVFNGLYKIKHVAL